MFSNWIQQLQANFIAEGKEINWKAITEIVSTIYEVMPGVLTGHGKTTNPYSNVATHTHIVEYLFCEVLWLLKEYNYYTVLFGMSMSRAIGALSQLQLFWDIALNLSPLR
eukprot:gene9250-19201_t